MQRKIVLYALEKHPARDKRNNGIFILCFRNFPRLLVCLEVKGLKEIFLKESMLNILMLYKKLV